MSKITEDMLVKADLILKKAKTISPTAITDFVFVLDQYEELANLINDQQIMPHVGKFDSSADQFVGLYNRHKISEIGYQKINLITMRCEELLRLNKSKHEEKASKKNAQEKLDTKNSSWQRFVIELVVLFLGCFSFYEWGKDNGVIMATQKCNDNMKARDSLSFVLENYIELQQKYDSLNISDSIAIFQEKQYHQELRDSIKKVTTSNQFLAERADSSKHIIDSLDDKLKKEIEDSNLLFKELKKTRDSLHSNILCNSKGLKK